MSRRTEYVTLSVVLKNRTARGAQLQIADDATRCGWVPRACLHFLSDKAVAEASIGDTLEVRVMEWVAETERLI